jgi:N-methylhydantoinase A
LYLSGPSAAVSGAASLARQAELPSLITLDVGGTSTDICLVTDGEVHETGHGGAFGTVQGQPLNMVMSDIVTIGAGGGSIAWVDDGGMLKVGPKSAGAEPGPACYGRGGTDFTLTDAMLCLGLLRDGAILPGGIALSRSHAEAAAAALRETLEMDLLALAGAVYRIAIANMAEAIRSVTVRRGYDPRDYTLFACGGAGPMVAAPLAEELEISTVLVPPDPGVFSAFGLTASGLRMDFASAIEADGAAIANPADFDGVLQEMTAQADAAFADVGASELELQHSFTADVRYAGQGFELRVPLERAQCREAGAAYLAACFHDVHAQRYGHAFPEQRIEVTALRLTATSAPASAIAHWRSSPGAAAGADRAVWADGDEVQAAVIERAGIDPDAGTSGPALFAEPTTTTWVPPRWRARGDQFGLLHLEREGT